MVNKKNIKRILILGSGALKIGEAGEFDYSGSQAIKALKEEGKEIILVNPNIATIQTSKELADKVYFLPITPYFVEKILAKEKPEGILLSFGGQTALNCGLELYKSGILKKHSVEVLGTPVQAIILTEDRQEFAKHLAKLNIPTPKSKVLYRRVQDEAATTLKQAEKIAQKIGFPVMIRAGFALGGQGSGVAKNMQELRNIVTRALAFAPQVLIEQYLHHFKEIEYEVVRDQYDNCITVCNMENMDPLGIHTGESIVVAPSQTLTNNEYHGLRKAAIEIVRSLGIVGECNVQFALNPKKRIKNQEVRIKDNRKIHNSEFIIHNSDVDYYVIEVNARLSRSSALASKATGYPLAYIAAKLALGYNLTQLKNKVTGVTQACFEPALDYVVVKIPRWDLQKFKGAEQQLGSSMKSVGEVMGIGRTFEEAYQKAIRMLDLDYEGAAEGISTSLNPTPTRIFALAEAIKQRISIEKIYQLTGIDPWFLYRIKNIVSHEEVLRKKKILSKEYLLELKQLGFSDKRIGQLLGKTELEMRELRKKYLITPSMLQIDTLAAEFPAKTNYLYTTYNANHNDVEPTGKNGIVVLGSGPYRIGSSVEFDWCSVNTVFGLKKHNKQSIIINCNPETVSTDYDISDRLYFEELTFERIADIYEFENPLGIIVSVGGQIPNNHAQNLFAYKMKILGTHPKNIDRAEDREKFSKLLDTLGIQQPPWNTFLTFTSAVQFAKQVGFPVLIRPSFVLSGKAMHVCYTQKSLRQYLRQTIKVSRQYPIVVSKFFEKAKEVEIDAVAQHGEVKTAVISEHIEYAGVHSGDATIVLPTQTISNTIQEEIYTINRNVAKALAITGPYNIQFLVKDDRVYIIEMNLRASRTFPFISKVTGINMIQLFVDSLFRKAVRPIKVLKPAFVAIKVPQFSFARLSGAHPILGVEMASTGEVACFGETSEEAFLKGILATGGRIPAKGIFVSIGGNEKKESFVESMKQLTKLGLPIYATEKTTRYFKKHGIKAKRLYKIHQKKFPNVLDFFQRKEVDLVINIADKTKKKELTDNYIISRIAIDNNIPLFTKIKNSKFFIKALLTCDIKTIPIKSWNEYNQKLLLEESEN